jgi:hypothetical protein
VGGKTPTQLGPLDRANLNHWTTLQNLPSVCVPPLMSETKFHTHTEPQAKLLVCIF